MELASCQPESGAGHASLARVFPAGASGPASEPSHQDSSPRRCALSQVPPAIAHYVQRYAGGTNFSLLQWLAHFSTQVQATLLLGSQFMTALAMLDFKDPTSVFPLLRTAIWTTQLTSNASRDGYAAALSKNDLDKLLGPAMLARPKPWSPC